MKNRFTERSTRESKLSNMLSINKAQKEYYERLGHDLNRGTNIAGRLWGAIRGRTERFRRDIGIKQLIREKHYEWLGDLTGKRVLDLGCDQGNSVSIYLATHAGFYLGVDLSENSIKLLQKKLEELNLQNANAMAIDFLSSEFPYEPFDVIYANGVLHHFESFESMLKILRERLTPNGRVISFDPLQTSLVVRLVRFLYRPFQKDADWEWPFGKDSIKLINKHFHIEAIQGIVGAVKWGIPFLLLPFGESIALKLFQGLQRSDQKKATSIGPNLWSCMNVALHLRRRENILE